MKFKKIEEKFQRGVLIPGSRINSRFYQEQLIFQDGAGHGCLPILYGNVEVGWIYGTLVVAAYYVYEVSRLSTEAAKWRKLCPVNEVKPGGVWEGVGPQGAE